VGTGHLQLLAPAISMQLLIALQLLQKLQLG
jgi:hypothetical protein